MKPDLSTALTLQDLENSKFDVLYRWVYEINGLSDGAIILYTMARNMWELSKQNRWVDEAGRIYFYLTRKSIQEKRNSWSLDKISRLINELEEAKLLIVVRESGEANKYYLENDIQKIINHNDNKATKDKEVDVKTNQPQNKTGSKISLPQSENKTTQSQNKSLMKLNNNTKGEKLNSPNTHARDKPSKIEVLETTVIELNPKSFRLKKETGFNQLSHEYKQRLSEFINEQRRENPQLMSVEEFFTSLEIKNYKYLNFALAYIKWNSKNKVQTQSIQPKGYAKTLNAMQEFLQDRGISYE